MKYIISKRMSEKDVIEAVDALFRKSGYRVIPQLKIRTWRPDIVAVKGEDVIIIEAKGYQSDMRRALAQAALYSTDATSAYLALPQERIGKDVRETARVLGIGLIGVDEKARIQLRAIPSKPRPSLLRRINKSRNAVAHSSLEVGPRKFSALDRL